MVYESTYSRVGSTFELSCRKLGVLLIEEEAADLGEELITEAQRGAPPQRCARAEAAARPHSPLAKASQLVEREQEAMAVDEQENEEDGSYEGPHVERILHRVTTEAQEGSPKLGTAASIARAEAAAAAEEEPECGNGDTASTSSVRYPGH